MLSIFKRKPQKPTLTPSESKTAKPNIQKKVQAPIDSALVRQHLEKHFADTDAKTYNATRINSN